MIEAIISAKISCWGIRAYLSKNLPDKKKDNSQLHIKLRDQLKPSSRWEVQIMDTNQSVSKNLPAVYEGNGSTETSR